MLPDGKCVLLDTGVLALLVVGKASPALIERHKRTNTFTTRDFDLLRSLIGGRLIVASPHVLAEVSNLVRQSGAADRVATSLAEIISLVEERYQSSANHCASLAFRKLGLTDATICELARQGVVVVTTDFDLYGEILRLGGTVVNFNQLRPRSQRPI